MKNVVVRALSGAVYVGLIVASIFLGHYYFFGLMAIFAALSVFEISSATWHLTHKGVDADMLYPYTVILDSFTALVTVFALPFMVVQNAPVYLNIVAIFAAVLIVAYLPLRITLGLYEHSSESVTVKFQSIALSVMGVLYVALPLAALNFLYSFTGHTLVLAIFVLIWLNDTGAFCFGSTLGRRKLWESLSPKKSWEGFWGGMLCCVVFAIVWSLFPAVNSGINTWGWIILAVLVSAFSTWGDLFESLLKRAAGVKDSSHLIPGHGGILDRIDSLLLVAPVALVFDLLVFML